MNSKARKVVVATAKNYPFSVGPLRITNVYEGRGIHVSGTFFPLGVIDSNFFFIHTYKPMSN